MFIQCKILSIRTILSMYTHAHRQAPTHISKLTIQKGISCCMCHLKRNHLLYLCHLKRNWMTMTLWLVWLCTADYELWVSSLYTVHSLGLVERHTVEGEVGLAGQDAGGRGARCRVADLRLHGDLIRWALRIHVQQQQTASRNWIIWSTHCTLVFTT